MSFKMLQQITDNLISEYPESQAWSDSPFSWIRHLPPGSKGVIGRHIGSGLLQSYGLTPTARTHQLRVNGQGIIVRVAMIWEKGLMKFQNIRDGNFDHVLCFGLCPHAAFAWLIPKNQIWVDHAIRTDRPGITRQHKGADAWISIDPDNVRAWLKPYGGTIEQAMTLAKKSL